MNNKENYKQKSVKKVIKIVLVILIVGILAVCKFNSSTIRGLYNISPIFYGDNVITFVLYGRDESGGGMDVVVLGFVNTDNMGVHLISIPRDLSIKLSVEAKKDMELVGLGSNGEYSLITNLGRTPRGEIVQIVTDEISRMFNTPIDYYFSIDTGIFVSVVDLLGGVNFYVPQDMYYHNGERLLVDLKEGQQTLTGAQAEGLVRFRGYPLGDFDRTTVQRDFMGASLKQVIGSGKEVELVGVMLSQVQTNFTNPIPHLGILGKLDKIKIHSYMLPMELKHNSWFLYDGSFELVDSVIKQVYK
jgi:polyisoprenyl-teichoic acid--peptidoglycan teichoic acid transferase